MGVTWQNVKDLVYESLGDTEGAEAFFTQATILRHCNECLREAAERTEYFDLDHETTSVSGTAEYTVNPGAFAVWRVEYDDEVCLPITSDELRRVDRFWSTRTGTPRFYLMDEIQDDADTVKVRLYETPNATGTSIRILCYWAGAAFTDVIAAYNLPLPEWFSYCLMYGILVRCYESDTEMQDFKKADFFRMLWEDALMRLRIRSFNRMNRKWRFKPAGNPERILNIRNRIAETIPEPS